jgi:eukaryotic-like serine/threonine-protein kinase
METPELKLRSVFNEALDRPKGPARLGYLDEACGGDELLRGQVEALLAAHEKSGSFLKTSDRPAQMFEGTPDPTTDQHVTEQPKTDQPATEKLGTKIGPYKLVQQLGEGGMGTVFLAEQAEPVKRRVALKLIKPGMDSAQVLRRFEAECQALALMDHSNIAKVLDAGTTADGRPYFVMELVKGVPITRYCDELRLSLGERLALFVPVC